MSESNDRQRVWDLPDRVAIQFCRMIDNDDVRLKETFKLAIQSAMSDAVVTAKHDLLQAVFDSGIAKARLVELVNKAIPTFRAGPELSAKVYGP